MDASHAERKTAKNICGNPVSNPLKRKIFVMKPLLGDTPSLLSWRMSRRVGWLAKQHYASQDPRSKTLPRANRSPQYRQDFVSAPSGAVASMCSTICGSTRCVQSALFFCMVYSAGPPV